MGKYRDSCPFLFPSSFRSLPSYPSDSTPPSSPSSSSPPPSPPSSSSSSRSDSSFSSPYKSASILPRSPLSDHSSASSHSPPAAFGPCAACKFHNRRCSERCYIASFLPPNDVHNFSVVDSVFGSGNVVNFLRREGTSSYIPLLVLLRDTGRENGGIHLDSKNNTISETDVHKQLATVVNSDHVRELIQGRELVKQLKVHLSSESSDIIREGLVQKILSSFEKSLSSLNLSGYISQLQNDVSTIAIASNDGAKSPVYLNGTPGSVNSDVVHSDGAKKRETLPRLTTQVKVISDKGVEEPLDDEINWIKYVQDDVVGTKFPRETLSTWMILGFGFENELEEPSDNWYSWRTDGQNYAVGGKYPRVEEEMDRHEPVTPKTNNIEKEKTLKLGPNVFFDDDCCLQNAKSSDDFIVDELLDFSNEADGLVQDEERHEKYSVHDKINDHSSDVELGDLANDLADLEWLSHFMEDSYSECFVPFPVGVSLAKPMEENSCGVREPRVPVKARSKRPRHGWSFRLPVLTSEPSSCPNSSASYSAQLKRRKVLGSFVALSFAQ